MPSEPMPPDSMPPDAMTLDEALRVRLSERLGPVFFSDLAAHLARDAVFVVSPSLALIECALAVAKDDVAAVEAWIAAGLLRKPSLGEREAWPKSTTRSFTAVVVQPFVLVQGE